MKKRSFLIGIATTMIFLSGCGIRKKNLLSALAPGLTKKEVIAKMGKPDTISSPIIDKKGNIIDIWEYSLATVNENQESKQLCAVIVLCLLCPILALIPALCMESPYSYEDYFLKFVNSLLFSWGKKVDIRIIQEAKFV